MAHGSPVPRMRFGTLVLALGALSGLVLAAKAATAERDGTDDDRAVVNLLADHGLVAGSDTAPSTAPLAAQAIGTAKVRDVNGAIVPLVPPGTPAIVMISSTSCSWCKRALKDLGEMSAGRPLPRFTLLTLEGARAGAPMTGREKLTGVRLVGPVNGTDEVLLTFRYPGTPTFVAIDRNGRVVHTVPGYPIRDELRRLWSVMVGDADAP